MKKARLRSKGDNSLRRGGPSHENPMRWWDRNQTRVSRNGKNEQPKRGKVYFRTGIACDGREGGSS